MNKRGSVRWMFDCNKWYPTRQEWMTASTSLQAEEKERIGRFYFKRDAKNAMAGRLLIRKFLTLYSGMKWRDIKVSRSKNGKPYFEQSGIKLNFNVSHQGGYAILAGEVGDISVGCDVMTVDYKRGERLSDFLRLMKKQFSDEEYNLVTCEKSENNICRMFYRIWCLKESYVKAIGTGLSLNLADVSFNIKDKHVLQNEFVTSTELTFAGELLTNWSFHETLIEQDTFAAVALSPKMDPTVDRFQALSFEELIKEAESLTSPDDEYCDNFFKKQSLPTN